jgi:hypothetical protein
MRLTVISILCCLLCAPTILVAAPKNVVAIFQYKGANSPLSKDKYETFQQIIEDKIDNLKREVFQSDLQAPAYLQDIEIMVHEQDTFTRRSGIKRWLKNQSSVLCLLRGAIVSDDNVTYMVKSNFHLGELTEYFPHDVVKIDLPVVKSEHANTKDSHSLVLLYALAMDAKRVGSDSHHIARFLTSALNKLADMKRRSGQLKGDLATLEQAIIKAANDLLGGDNGS